MENRRGLSPGAPDASRVEPAQPPRRRWRQCFCACLLAHSGGPYERFMAERKQQLMSGLRGTVLEIGPGTGVNLSYLPRGVRYIASEPNRYMHRYLSRAAAEQEVDLDLRPVAFEALDLPDGSVDAIICTLVLCSVEDPAEVMLKAKRLLRPGGRFVFVEHVAAAPGTWHRGIQLAVKPGWRILGDGCNPDRETWRTIEEAGFGSLNYERFRAPLPVVSPHIAGIGEIT